MTEALGGAKIVVRNAVAAVLCGLLAAGSGWLTVYFDTSVDDAFVKGFGILIFGSMTVIYLTVAIFIVASIRRK